MDDIDAALAAITDERLLEHIRILASDEFAGRQPGLGGEDLTVTYLRDRCSELGLRGSGPGGSFFQDVPVVSNTPTASAEFSFPGADPLRPAHFGDFLVRSPHPVASLERELVFVGFGVRAPEYDWDDFGGADLRGKILVMLSGDPNRPDPADPGRLDEAFFRGSGMTYHGRWRNKYDVAAGLGAAGCFVVHDDVRAGYPFSVIQGSWEGEHLGMETDPDRMPVEGWLSQDLARELARRAGDDFDDLEARAMRPDFAPVPLGATATISVTNETRRFVSRNVIAAVPGTDPRLAAECVVFSAHWDHLGQKVVDGEVVGTFRGAVDNASGVSSVLEIARAVALAPARRTTLFLFSTLEESGLLGAAYYVTDPAVPIDRTIAIVNLDMMNVWGRTSDVVNTGRGHSSLDDVLARRAAAQGRTVSDDPEPDKGYFYRSDHLEFMKLGVPALFFLHPGSDYRDRPAGFGDERRRRYVSDEYHKFADAVGEDWDLSGMVEDTRLLFLVGHDIADADERPAWSPDSEFSAAAGDASPPLLH